MTAYIFVIAAVCVAVSAAPPAPPRLYTQHAPAQLRQIHPLDYYLENQEVDNYYSQAQQKQGAVSAPNGAAARLELTDPDNEVELVPGVQQPQQPPQQTPVAPNIPGLIPGQRVFIVHMPVPGYRPGTIGGYQPVYIVAASPQGNPGYPGNGVSAVPGVPGVPGYQNAVLLDQSGQVVSPFLGYNRVALAPQGPGLALAGPAHVNRPYDLVYQDPAAIYQGGQAFHHPEAARGPIRYAQAVNLQGPVNLPVNQNEAPSSELKQAQGNIETKEPLEEPKRNAKIQAQIRNKA